MLITFLSSEKCYFTRHDRDENKVIKRQCSYQRINEIVTSKLLKRYLCFLKLTKRCLFFIFVDPRTRWIKQLPIRSTGCRQPHLPDIRSRAVYRRLCRCPGGYVSLYFSWSIQHASVSFFPSSRNDGISLRIARPQAETESQLFTASPWEWSQTPYLWRNNYSRFELRTIPDRDWFRFVANRSAIAAVVGDVRHEGSFPVRSYVRRCSTRCGGDLCSCAML